MATEKKKVLMISSGVSDAASIPSPTFLAIKGAIAQAGGEPVILDYVDCVLRKSIFNIEFNGSQINIFLKTNRRIYELQNDIHAIVMWHPKFPDLYADKKISYEGHPYRRGAKDRDHGGKECRGCEKDRKRQAERPENQP